MGVQPGVLMASQQGLAAMNTAVQQGQGQQYTVQQQPQQQYQQQQQLAAQMGVQGVNGSPQMMQYPAVQGQQMAGAYPMQAGGNVAPASLDGYAAQGGASAPQGYGTAYSPYNAVRAAAGGATGVMYIPGQQSTGGSVTQQVGQQGAGQPASYGSAATVAPQGQVNLSAAVNHRVMQVVAEGMGNVRFEHFDGPVCSMLAKLPQPKAMAVLSAAEAADLSQVRDVRGFLIQLIQQQQ
jgi:hypothetical protein